jgi:peptidoglycan hydrolase-like protein with peptidoglycan-binding domain
MGLSTQSVALAQTHLNDQGFNAGEVDGLIGSMTTSAIRAWQNANNVATTGTLTGDQFFQLTGCHLDQFLNPDYGEYLRLSGGVAIISHKDTVPVAGNFVPVGVVLHHTAANTNRDEIPPSSMIDGREDLSGPIVQFGVSRNGRIDCYTNGRANHAGKGDRAVLNAVRADKPLLDPIEENETGNSYFLGIEVDHRGTSEDPIDDRWTWAANICVALCKLWLWPASRIIGHKEWTDRKIDPIIEMDEFRNSVAMSLGQPPTMKPDVIVMINGKPYRLVPA